MENKEKVDTIQKVDMVITRISDCILELMNDHSINGRPMEMVDALTKLLMARDSAKPIAEVAMTPLLVNESDEENTVQKCEKRSEVRTKVTLEGAEDYIKEAEEIRETAKQTKISVDELNTSLGQLNESMKEFAELREKLF